MEYPLSAAQPPNTTNTTGQPGQADYESALSTQFHSDQSLHLSLPLAIEQTHSLDSNLNLSAISEFNESYDKNELRKRTAEVAQLDSNSALTKRHHADENALGNNLSQQNRHVQDVRNAAQSVQRPRASRMLSEEDEYEEDDDAEDPYEKSNRILLHPIIPHQESWGTPTNLLMDASTAVLWSANHGMRVRSLPVVDNLSTQILLTLGKGPYQETLNIVTCPESDAGQAYSLLKSLFDQTKKIYTTDAFLSPEDLKFEEPEQRAIIKKVNLATFVSSVFGSQEVGFFHLNECFLDTFIAENGRLLKSQGALYLDLKTQAYISALQTGERAKEDILNDLFPGDMEQILLSRRPGAKALTPSELDFVARAAKRKEHLLQLPDNAPLSDKYVWQDFLQDVSSYVSKHFDQIMAQPVRKQRKRRTSQHLRYNSGAQLMNSSPALRQDNGITQAPAEQPLAPLQARMQTPTQQDGSPHIESYEMQVEHELMQDETDAATAAALSAHNAAFEQQQYQQESSHLPDHLERQAPEDTADMVMNQELFGSTSEPNSPPHNLTMGGLPPLPLIPPQTTPTQILYERARLAAQSKASPNSRRSGLPSQRRPWTPEEESALMAGLDRVKGPHWSQILAMFGPGGTINEILKDRNQVQLKDKARNLKLFFLKSGIEVPYYLQFVTGELKTRAPSQAAKQAKLKAQGEGGNEDSSDYDAYDKVKDQDAPNAEMLEELGEIVQQHVEDDENSVSQQHHQHDQSRTHGHIDNNLNSLNGVHGIDGTGSGEHLHSQPLEQNYHHHDEDDDDATTRLAQALLSASSQAEHIQEQAHVQMPEQPHMQIQELAVGIQ